MTLSSLGYLACLVLVFVLSHVARRAKARLPLLLTASLAFYATWGLGFVVVLLVSAIANWALGAWLARDRTRARLWVGVGANVALLVFFKVVTPNVGGLASLVMPVGLSFWTFQALSYLFDVYREEDLDPTPLELALYLSFWPTVLSGPVARLGDVLPQLRAAAPPTWDEGARAVKRIIVGLFMKVVMAQVLANGIAAGEGVDSGFDQYASGWGGLDVWLLALGFGLQLYFDFAGYSHIAIGSAALFGVTLPENFERPYLATTPSKFWTKWHMSLSFWIRDYVFLPLATLVRVPWWKSVALALSMVVFGLWHDVTWPFFLWGLYHGLLLVAHRGVQSLRRRLRGDRPARPGGPGALEHVAAWALTMMLVMLGWIFFRAHSLDQIGAMLGAVASPASYTHLALRPNFYLFTGMVVVGYAAFVALDALARHHFERAPGGRVARALWLASPLYWSVALLLVILWSGGESAFVYFAY